MQEVLWFCGGLAILWRASKKKVTCVEGGDAKRLCVEGEAQHWDLLLSNCNVATMCAGAAAYGAVDGPGAVGVADGNIVFVGRVTELARISYSATQQFDCHGGWVTPGLIDCHTHIVYGGDRSEEWELKLKGASYEEVAKAGGGIVNTVSGTTRATVEELFDAARPRLDSRLDSLRAEGVTSIDIKSGYGLELDGERKML